MPVILLAGITLSYAFAEPDSVGFTGPMAVNSPGGNSTMPQLLVSGNDVYLGWVDNSAGKFGAKFAESNNGGSSFGKEVNLGTVGGAPDNLRMAEFQGKIGTVWQSYAANRSSVGFAESRDNGTTFSPPVLISDISKDSAFPQIAMYGNNVYVAWLDRNESDVTNVMFAKSDDGGLNFGPPMPITVYNGTSGIPKMYAENDRVYLMWESNKERNFDVFLSESTDYGKTFSEPRNLSGNDGNSGAPQMIIDGDNVYAVWMDDSSGNFEILFSKSTDGGKTFGVPVKVSKSMLDSGYPQFAVYGNNVYVAWTETITDKNYDIYFAKSEDGGKTFGLPLDISNTPGASGWPQISADGNVYVSWVDNTPGKFDIYIAKSTDDGNSFESPVDVNENGHGSWFNQMSASPDTVYLAWQGSGNQSSNIMFAKSTTFVPEFGSVAPLVLVITVVAIVLVSSRAPFGRLYRE